MAMTDPALADRDLRQRDLVPPARLTKVHAMVIGVGSVGWAEPIVKSVGWLRIGGDHRLVSVGISQATFGDHCVEEPCSVERGLEQRGVTGGDTIFELDREPERYAGPFGWNAGP